MRSRGVLTALVSGAFLVVGLLGCEQSGDRVSAGEDGDCSVTCEAGGNGSQYLVTCDGPSGKTETTVTCTGTTDGEMTVTCSGCPGAETTVTCEKTAGGETKCSVVHDGNACSADCVLHKSPGSETDCCGLAAAAISHDEANQGVCPGAAKSVEPVSGCPKIAGGTCPMAAATSAKTTGTAGK
ncbi:MAG: hypothetical protein JXB46_09930 [Candidatus Eisenbacteria bacterium]|nr:hypothetical protein [Candidatus Eisenbacteria bacterium]